MEVWFVWCVDDVFGVWFVLCGYVCVDDFFEWDIVDVMCCEFEWFVDVCDVNEMGWGGGWKYLWLNCIKFGDEYLFGKLNIYECDMYDDGMLVEMKRDAAYAMIWEFFCVMEWGMVDVFWRVILEIVLCDGLDLCMVKL